MVNTSTVDDKQQLTLEQELGLDVIDTKPVSKSSSKSASKSSLKGKNEKSKASKDKSDGKKREKRSKMSEGVEKEKTVTTMIVPETLRTVDAPPSPVSTDTDTPMLNVVAGKLVGKDDHIPENLRLSSYAISTSVIHALETRGITSLFAIQAETFKHIIAGKDLLGRARTGTGKTLAFALPIIERLKAHQPGKGNKASGRGRAPRVLVLTPTRELAQQVAREFEIIGKGFGVICVYGGVGYGEQLSAFREGIDIIVGTPGRVIDHLDGGNLHLNQLQFVVLDEADTMLDMGFADSMEKILNATKESKGGEEHQTLLFSATFPKWIAELASKYCRTDRITIDLVGNQKLKTSEKVKHLCIQTQWAGRKEIIGDIVSVHAGRTGKTIIFTNSKAEADELAVNEKLKGDAQVIHGDIVQAKREVTLKGFREGKFRTLIATDVAARGLDINEVDLVINMQPPKDIDTYVHRSGRTGRGATTRQGTCITFYKASEQSLLDEIARKTGTVFTKISTPQPADILKGTSEENTHHMELVSEEVLPYFTALAQAQIERFGAEEAMCRAMACMSGYTKPDMIRPRSLFSGASEYTTLIFRTEQPLHNAGFMRGILTRQFPTLDVYNATRGFHMARDGMSVVADFLSDKVKVVKQVTADDEGNEHSTDVVKFENKPWTSVPGVTVELCTVLPELIDNTSSRSASGGYQSYGREQRGGGAQRNSRGGAQRKTPYGGGRSAGGDRKGRGGGNRGGRGGRNGGSKGKR